MKHIQLKDAEQDNLYPYTKWSLINDIPDIYKNYTTANSLINILLTSIPGYNASNNQTLKNIHGTYRWVDD